MKGRSEQIFPIFKAFLICVIVHNLCYQRFLERSRNLIFSSWHLQLPSATYTLPFNDGPSSSSYTTNHWYCKPYPLRVIEPVHRGEDRRKGRLLKFMNLLLRPYFYLQSFNILEMLSVDCNKSSLVSHGGGCNKRIYFPCGLTHFSQFTFDRTKYLSTFNIKR